METTMNPLTELGDWKPVQAYPMYKISSTGAVMNKRTLKILKHFLYEESVKNCKEPCVTLYRAKVGDVLPVKQLLEEHFPGATLPTVKYNKNKAFKKQYENDVDLFLDD